jgi:LacI family transcriptional regulator
VLAVATELGYSPSALARALVTRKSRIVGVVVDDIVDPHFAEIVRGVEDVAGGHRYLTAICSTDRSTTAELEHVRALRDYHPAGVVFASSGHADDASAHSLGAAVAEMQRHGCVVVALAPRQFECISAVVDNEAAAYDITSYLISLGHRRIAFVEGTAGLFTSQRRLVGFTHAMAGAGLSPKLCFDGGFDYESGRNAALKVLASTPLPDAIVAANDAVAIGVLMTLRQAGVDVPGRVSVVGIDGTLLAAFVELTTVKVPLYDLGVLAARIIVAEHGEGARPDTLTLPYKVTLRGTSAPRPGNAC